MREIESLKAENERLRETIKDLLDFADAHGHLPYEARIKEAEALLEGK